MLRGNPWSLEGGAGPLVREIAMGTFRLPLLTGALVLLAACGGGGDDAAAGGGGGGGGGGSTAIGGTGLALHVLVGGTSKPTATDLYLDSRLAAGEIFVMPKAALGASTTYSVSVVASTASGEKFNHTWSFTTAAGAVTAGVGATVLSELNAYRSASVNLPAVTSDSGYATAATKHAGYQCETNAINHNEPDNTKLLYVNTDFWRRISLAKGGTASSNTWGTGIDTVFEDIASTGGADAVPQLWNTVYHRVPMMRRQVSIIGNGDRTAAAALPGSDVSGTGTGYQTIDFGGVSGTAVMTSYWPHDGTTNVFQSFNTDQETPDPVGLSNTNGTPTAVTVGPPIHVLLPTTEDFTALTITVTP
jgi:uncharacterized protein YkwD